MQDVVKETKVGRIFVRRDEVTRVTGLPVSTLYELISRGKFPKPIRISPGRVGWLLNEVEGWQQERIDERDGAAA